MIKVRAGWSDILITEKSEFKWKKVEKWMDSSELVVIDDKVKQMGHG